MGSIAWLEIHYLVSADNSIREISHLIFGAEMATATLLTGTIIIPEILHATNNLFITIQEQYGQVYLLLFFGLEFMLLMILIVSLEMRKRQ